MNVQSKVSFSVLLKKLFNDQVVQKVIASFAISLIFPAVLSYFDLIKKYKANDDINLRIKELSDVQESLKNLNIFLENQKSSMIDLSRSVENLKNEKGKIEPLLKVDRQQAAALLELYESRVSIWRERGWGFFIGIVTSIIGNIVFLFLTRHKNNKVIGKELK